MNWRTTQKLKRVFFWLAVLVVIIFSVFPFYYAVVTSLKPTTSLFTSNVLPKEIDVSHYYDVFAEQPFARNIYNSVLVAMAVVLISLALGVMAAYALGRVNFKGRGILLMTILGVSMFPQVAVLSGMFHLIRSLGLYNNLLGLILANLILTLPFTVWVLTTFMRELPKELEEAAYLDGATPLQMVIKVFMPLMWPALVTTGLLAFIAAWNEFLFALTFTLSNDMRTVPVAIALITGSSQYELPWGNIMAACVIVTLPLIILVLIFQRKIVSGLTTGAIKG